MVLQVRIKVIIENLGIGKMADDDEEYCAKCGYSEFNDDGTESHADEKEYDHDFEYEEEDEGTTLEDVKEFADTVKSLAEAGKAVKEVLQPSKINPLELTSDRFKVPPPIEKVRDLKIDLKLPEHPDTKAEKRHNETMKWTKIGIVVGAVVAIILGTVAIIFS